MGQKLVKDTYSTQIVNQNYEKCYILVLNPDYFEVLEFMKRYNDIIRELREDNDLTQKQVAEILGTKQQVYSRYELGIRALPISLLIKLSKFYNVSTDYILCLEKDKK